MRIAIGRATTWVPAVLGIFALALIPWTFIYIDALPAHHVTRHWDLVWVGFDLAIAAMLTMTALAARFGRVWLPAAAAASAASWQPTPGSTSARPIQAVPFSSLGLKQGWGSSHSPSSVSG
jgi:uncharacterized membrane protein